MIKKIEKQKLQFIFLIILCVSIGIELVLSNINFLNILNSKKNIEAKIMQGADFKVYIDTNNISVQNIKIYYKNQNKKQQIIKYTININTYGNVKYNRQLENRYQIGKTNKKININSENKTKKIYLSIYNQDKNKIIGINEIDKIVLNDTHLEFSITRAFLIFIILSLIILAIKKRHCLYDKKNKKQLFLFYIIVSILYSLILIEIHLVPIKYTTVETKINNYNFNFLNAEVEAIVKGKKEMLLKPTKQLKKLNNPYDNSVRIKYDSMDIYTDYSLYKNKIYSYFGLAPVILFMLPFKLITGSYISNFLTSFIFLFILINVFATLYKTLIDRYIKKVTFLNFILGFITLFFTTSIPILARGMVYDIVQIFGMIFIMLSYILILSIYNNPNSKINIKTILISTFMGFIVLSKPSYICYYLLLIYLIFNLRKILDHKKWIHLIKIFCVPITIIGMFQMIFNYIRFDSIFCFGFNYQLTTFDNANLTYFSLLKTIKGFILYLFQLPEIDLERFPFLFIKQYEIVNNDMGVMTYAWDSLGLLIIPIAWIYFHRIWNIKINKELKNTTKILNIVFILLLIVNSTIGVAEVYMIDIKIFMYTFSIILFLKLIEKKDIKYAKSFYFICIISILITLPICMTQNQIDFKNIDTVFKVKMNNLFQFWI